MPTSHAKPANGHHSSRGCPQTEEPSTVLNTRDRFLVGPRAVPSQLQLPTQHCQPELPRDELRHAAGGQGAEGLRLSGPFRLPAPASTPVDKPRTASPAPSPPALWTAGHRKGRDACHPPAWVDPVTADRTRCAVSTRGPTRDPTLQEGLGPIRTPAVRHRWPWVRG